ncbi:TonB-dependent receptor plug domain-containing protein [Brevundimonas sp.]|uniref:TonB-dependent receptor plug domain-containing protein n=1 Tax=Brevundimonas sp. TaxID=1871086 RepID=UPI00391C0406
MTRTLRTALTVSASAAALFALAPQAGARTQSPPASEVTAVDEIIVTGTRVQGRSRFETLAPVDVVTTETLQQRGTTEFAAALAQTVPALSFPRPSVTDGTDSIRPATLRGLSPDQTLVLVNGVRRHASALVNVNGSVGRGSAAVDLNAIPSAALDRVEVLRDGASAQYGSDAIAGVVNLRLREAASGGGASVTYGQYFTTVETARGERDEEDGQTVTVSGWQGLPLGDGYLTISAEYLQRDPTNRSDFDPNPSVVPPGSVTARLGDPEVEQWTLFANAGVPVRAGWEAYGWAGYQDRESESAAFPRRPDNVNSVPAIYPDGFLPKIAVNSEDTSIAGGVRGELAGWNADFRVAYGRNDLAFRTEDSLNSTYGAASPTSFDSGGLIYGQLVYGAEFSRGFDVGRIDPLTLSWGLEGRRETYEIIAGQPESYNRGPLGGNTSLASGAQGFPGFQPSNEVDVDRDAFAAFVEADIPLTDRWRLAGAIRAEDYSDFGGVFTGKLSTRYELTPDFALRATVSSGFRAPSLQQQYFTSTASVIQDGNIVETGTFPASSPIAQALGARDLEPEKALNLTAGLVWRAGNFDLSVDAYRIEIDNQIALSELINRSFSPQVAALLDPFGVQAARFFLNGVDTVTEGVDVVARYRLPTVAAGDFDFTLAANFNDTEVNALPDSSSVLDPVPVLFSRSRVESIQQGTPDSKIVFSTNWSLNQWGATARAAYYSDVVQPSNTPANDLHTGDNTIVDIEGRYRFTDRVALAIGVDNVFDQYPDFVPAALNSSGVLGFPFYSPFGFNGRYAYARLSLNW